MRSSTSLLSLASQLGGISSLYKPRLCWPVGGEHRATGARYVTAVFLLIHLQQEPCAKPEHVGRGSLEEEIFQSHTEKAFSPLVYRL